jgi:hypothetical protein
MSLRQRGRSFAGRARRTIETVVSSVLPRTMPMRAGRNASRLLRPSPAAAFGNETQGDNGRDFQKFVERGTPTMLQLTCRAGTSSRRG